MSDISDFNPTGRFTGLASTYAQHRPGYPDDALDYIVSTCGLDMSSLLVDVGCGTGISARAFAMRGIQIIGIEPNADMRQQAEADALPAPYKTPEYKDGSAEATGLADQSADAVLSAQAFHWFRPEQALQEFHRVLKPSGWCILMWNERDESDPFTKAYGDILRTLPDTAAVEGARVDSGDALLVSQLFHSSKKVLFHNQQHLDFDGVLGRALSASYVPKDPTSVENLTRSLRTLFEQYQHDGYADMRYETSVYLGQGQR